MLVAGSCLGTGSVLLPNINANPLVFVTLIYLCHSLLRKVWFLMEFLQQPRRNAQCLLSFMKKLSCMFLLVQNKTISERDGILQFCILIKAAM